MSSALATLNGHHANPTNKREGGDLSYWGVELWKILFKAASLHFWGMGRMWCIANDSLIPVSPIPNQSPGYILSQ